MWQTSTPVAVLTGAASHYKKRVGIIAAALRASGNGLGFKEHIVSVIVPSTDWKDCRLPSFLKRLVGVVGLDT